MIYIHLWNMSIYLSLISIVYIGFNWYNKYLNPTNHFEKKKQSAASISNTPKVISPGLNKVCLVIYENLPFEMSFPVISRNHCKFRQTKRKGHLIISSHLTLFDAPRSGNICGRQSKSSDHCHRHFSFALPSLSSARVIAIKVVRSLLFSHLYSQANQQ